MTKVVITGAKGRMGQSLIACAPRFPDIEVVGKIDVGDDLEGVLRGADVLIDFSFHSGTAVMAEACARHKAAMIIGTTGHLEDEKTRILAQTTTIPIVWASNYSTGVNTLFWLTRKAAQILGPTFDLEIIEMHHRLKKDAPSGTAMTLAEILAAVRNEELSAALRHGREGIVGERSAREIGMHSVRGGDVVGDHTVIFATTGERVELTHKASNRETFANGALRAALWVPQQPPGLYNMQHVLGLQE
jgi:4-hydroxy-tetrahydrodipicolinate reductase